MTSLLRICFSHFLEMLFSNFAFLWHRLSLIFLEFNFWYPLRTIQFSVFVDKLTQFFYSDLFYFRRYWRFRNYHKTGGGQSRSGTTQVRVRVLYFNIKVSFNFSLLTSQLSVFLLSLPNSWLTSHDLFCCVANWKSEHYLSPSTFLSPSLPLLLFKYLSPVPCSLLCLALPIDLRSHLT